MISYREEVLRSWVLSAPSVRGLAALLGVPTPFGMRALIDRLRFVETITVDRAIHTDDSAPINGFVRFVLRSDGSYVFSGFVRATGLLSFHFSVQAWVNVAEGAVIAAHEVGNVFGLDTPGDEQKNWSEAGVNKGVVLRWRSLRAGRGMGHRLDAHMTGVLGAAGDVLRFAIKAIVTRVALGPVGWIVLIGSELTDLDARLASPNILAGIAVGAATFLIVGPYGLVPALVLGAATVALIDIRHRKMHPHERAFADRVFGGKINYDNVLLTNLSHDNGRKFTIPSIGEVILVNLNDDAFENPIGFADPPGGNYPEPGAVFIHELAHAWQIENNSFIGVICGMDSNYEYHDSRGRTADTAWPRRRWSTLNNEQQAHIVDDWYAAHLVRVAGKFVIGANGAPVTDLDGIDALNDPAFHFIHDNIRARRV